MRIASSVVLRPRPLILAVLVFVFASVGSTAVGWAQPVEGTSADTEWRFIQKLEQDGMQDLVLRQLQNFAQQFREDPRAPGALLRAADGFRELGQTVTAASLYERLLRDFPSSEQAAAAALSRADLHTEAEQWDAAVRGYRGVLENHPASEQAEPAMLGLAEALMAQRDDVEARRLLGRLVGGRASDEVASRAMFDLGLLDLRAGADSLAIERFDSIHRRYPGRPIGAFGLLRAAELFENDEATVAARSRYESVLELYGEPLVRARAHLGLAALVEEDDPGLAAGHFRAVAEEGGSAAQVQEALLGLARSALAAGAPDETREAVAAYLERYPDGPGLSRVRLLDVRARLAKKDDGAFDALLALGDQRDRDVAYEALALAANTLEGRREDDAALDAWRRAEVVAPAAADRANALLEQARLSRGLGRSALAADLALAAHDAADTDDVRAAALLAAALARAEAGDRAGAIELAQRTATEHPLTEQASAAREELTRLRRLAAADAPAAARELADLARRQIDDPAARSLEVGRILRDRLADPAAAIAAMTDGLGQARTPEDRARMEIEIARTYQQQALQRGLAGDVDGARDALRAARSALTEAAARAGAEVGAQTARVMLVGLDLAEAARPDEPWTFDPETMPLLGAVGAAERVDLGAAALDATRRRLGAARENAKGADQQAWIAWRWAEVSDAPVEERIAIAREALDRKPSRELQTSLRLVLGQLLLEQGETAAAARELSRVVESGDAGEAAMAARYALAEAQRAEKRYVQAGDLYAEYATAYPQTQRGQRALLLAGDCALFAGRSEDAVVRYRQLLDRYPGSVYEDDALYRLGTALERSGRLDAAREPLLRLSKWSGNSDYRARALALLASIEQRAGRDDEARAALEGLVAADTDRAREEQAWTQLATLSLEAGDPAAALDWLDRGAKQAEPDARAFALRVRAASAKGDLGAATAALESLSRGFPDAGDAIARARLDVADAQRQAGRLDAARESAEIALAEAGEAGTRAHAHYELGMVHAQAQRWAEARDAFVASEKAGPQSEWAAESLYKLGGFYSSQNEFPSAQKAFATLVQRFARHALAPDALKGEARAWRQMGRYDEALERYHRVLEEYPEAPGAEDVLNNIAYCYHEMGQYEVAIAAYRRVMPYLDEEGQAYAVYWIADGLFQLGRYAEAATEFLRIPYLYSDQGMLPVTAQLRAGEAYEAMTDFDAARSLYERVLRSHGAASDWGREAQKRLDRIAEKSPQEGERGSR